MFLAKALPLGKPKQRKSKGRSYVFPALPELREAFEKRFNVTVEAVEFRDDDSTTPKDHAQADAGDLARDPFFRSGGAMEAEAGIALSEVFEPLECESEAC
jgi:hypothetical protein